jgi:Na+/melibiose symporter-like transporter
MLGLMGAIYGSGPMNYMCKTLGYQYVTIVCAVFGIVLATFAYFITPNFAQKEKISIMTNIKEVLGSKKVISICILAGLMVGPLEGFADVWGSQFFQIVYGYDGTVAASLTSVIFLGMCFGSPILCFIAAKIKNDLLTIFIAGIAMTLCFSILMFQNINISLITLMFIIIGISCAYQILAIFKASTYVNESAVGLTTSIANMIIMIFGYAFHSSIGAVVDAFGGISSVNGIKYGVAIIPITLCIGTIGFGINLWRENITTKYAVVNPA